MQTLYIDRRDTRLEVDRERLLVYSAVLPKPLSIAFAYLSAIVMSAKTQLHSHVLLACARRGIAVIILDPRCGESYAQYLPPTHKMVHRKIKQFEMLQNHALRFEYAKQLYGQNLQQVKLLNYWFKHFECQLSQQQSLIDRLKTNIHLLDGCDNMAQLRGLEGSSAKIVFHSMSLLAPSWTKFQTRNRRPPQDPINVLLSLSYHLIYAECTRALNAHGLDPMLGFYHEPTHGRYSLACDLSERLRCDIEKWVMQLILDTQLKPAHFGCSEQYPCVLNKEGRAIFYPLWERRVPIWKTYLRLHAQQWAKHVDQYTTY